MDKQIKKQVEAQGVKKLDSIKGVQALNMQELKEVEGGVAPIVVALAIAIYFLSTQKAY